MRTTFDFDRSESQAASQFLFEKFPDLAAIACNHMLDLHELPHSYLKAEATGLVRHPDLHTRVIALSSLLHLDVLSSLDFITEENVDQYMTAAEDSIHAVEQFALVTKMGVFRALMDCIKDYSGLWKEFLVRRNYPELSVCNYLEELSLLKSAGAHRKMMGATSQGADQRARRFMQQAKIFDVDPALYTEAKELLFARTCGELDVDETLADPYYEADHLMAMMHEWSIDAPMPEVRPFSNVYIAYRAGIAMDRIESSKYFSQGDMDTLGIPMDRYRIMGHLIGETGEVWTFARGHMWGLPDAPHTWVHLISWDRDREGRWSNGITMVPWTVPTFLELIEEYKTVALEPMRVHRDLRKKLKKLKGGTRKSWAHQPMPYYHVKLRSKTIRHKIMGTLGVPYHLTYRHDVRAHFRLRVRRGPLPLQGRDREELMQPSASGNVYKVFEKGALPDDLQFEMTRRGLPGRRDGEWVAIMEIRVREHTKGPEDAPYIPALRLLDLSELSNKAR